LTKTSKNTSIGIKDYYRDYFTMGVSVSGKIIHEKKYADLILKEFKSLTPENAMKMEPLHPKENVYNWKEADAIVEFAQKNNLKVRGHALCWHEQAPEWIFKDENNNLVDKATLLKRLKEHVYTVVKRYKGKIYAWDVVNEAVDDKGDHILRNSLWYKICGEDFIFEAFKYAHEADPNALLFYNDYNTTIPEKTEKIYTLLKKLKDNNIPVHGIGMQGHFSIYQPSKHDLVNAIEKFKSLDLQIQITELDVSVYPWEKNKRSKNENDNDSFSIEKEEMQKEKYAMIFEVLRSYKENITGVTFWNVTDDKSWLNNYPVKNRKNYPLLFDAELNRKEVYKTVTSF
jgi:endo-1,4-beta-xylanase